MCREIGHGLLTGCVSIRYVFFHAFHNGAGSMRYLSLRYLEDAEKTGEDFVVLAWAARWPTGNHSIYNKEWR